MSDRIYVTKKLSGPNAGRWAFYIDKEYRGSAGTRTNAMRAAKELLAKIESYEKSQQR